MKGFDLLIKHISYSYLHLLACPYAAFLRYEAAIKSPINEYLALGNALHLALERNHVDGVFKAKEAHDLFVKEFHRQIDEEDIFIGYPKKKKLEAEGANMLATYAGQIERGIIDPKPTGVEVEFKIPYNGLLVVGRIDRTDYSNEGGWIITDYKSGSKEPDPWFLRHNLQLTAYAWACQEMYGELPTKLVWHQLRSGKLLTTERTQADIDQLKKMIDNAIFMSKNKIRHRIFHEQICNWCNYAGAGNECEDLELEERLNARRLKSRGDDQDTTD